MSRFFVPVGLGGLLVVALVVAVSGVAGLALLNWREANGVSVCIDSYDRWQGLTGHWEGTWVNHTFSSNGTLTMDVVINENCTAEATIEGIFNQSGLKTINAIYHDGNSTVIEVQNDPIFGDTTIVIEDDGALTVNGTELHQAIDSVTGTGDVSATQLDLNIEMDFVGGGSATETIHVEKEVTDTPTPTPSPEPTPSPTPTASPSGLVQGNVDCNASVNAVDSLKLLRFVAQLTVGQEVGCPLIGADIGAFWGDVDCNDNVNSVDALKVLRYVAMLTVSQNEPCADIGTPFDH